MTREERLFELVKVFAPTMMEEGLALQKRIIDAGSNPADCNVGGKSIVDAYAESAVEWAEAFMKAFEKTTRQ